ncbi:MAG: redox-sensing transcriptional repressor Rex, partial [Duncaniella sp.]|nr:redox-sensing transcriptional repressor Rex [Duncaniella sp.]
VVGTTLGGKPIYHLSELPARLKELDAEIAVIAVPVESAAEVAQMCVDAGIKALWNFTPFHIKTTPAVAIQNTSIYAHLAVMYNRMPK